MYIYQRQKIVQVHFNKTGGTSLRCYLDQALGEESLLVYGKHNTITEALAHCREGYSILTTVRNPYDRLVSLHAFRRKRFANGERGASEQRLQAAHDLCFLDWLRQDLLPNAAAGAPMDQPLSAMLGVFDGLEKSLTVLRMEELGEAAPAFVRSLGISAPALSQKLNVSTHLPWRDCYNKHALDLIYEWDRYVFDNFYPMLKP